jgi:cobalt-zinc-cadmium efflux system protein
MRATRTYEECKALQQAHHKAMEVRAKEKGARPSRATAQERLRSHEGRVASSSKGIMSQAMAAPGRARPGARRWPRPDERAFAPSRHGRIQRAFAIGIALNLAFVIIEAGYGWKVGSLALLADAGHNLSDVAGLVLAWAAALVAGRLPDQRHTYGWQRASILAAFANAVLLLVAMGSLLWEASRRLQVPAPTDGITIMVVAAIGVLVNGATAALFMSGSKSDMNIRGAFLHMAGGRTGLARRSRLRRALPVRPAGPGSIRWPAWRSRWRSSPAPGACSASRCICCSTVFRTASFSPRSPLQLRALPDVTDVHDLHVWAMSTTDIALTRAPGDARRPSGRCLPRAALRDELHTRFPHHAPDDPDRIQRARSRLRPTDS